MNRNYIFQQSKEWWIDKDLDWLIKNAEYVYNHNYHNGYRPHIKTKIPMSDGSNIFELDNDKWGILIKGHSKMNEFTKQQITKQSEDVEKFLVDFYKGYGCEEFINPTNMFWKKLMNPKLKFV